MSPRFAPSRLSALFGRPTGTPTRSRRRRDATRHDRQRFAPFAEALESRKLLAVFYRGVIQSNTASTDESFNYIVDVDATGTGEIYLRYEALQNRIDIADNPGFGTVTNAVIPPRPGFVGPAVVPQNIATPFSLGARVTVPQVAWNVAGTLENFSSGALTIRAGAGSRVFVANGDPLPLALRVLSAGGGSASTIEINGPVDSTVNPYANAPTTYNNILTADVMTVRAAMSTVSATQFFANSLVNLQNVVTSPGTNAYVGNGDFHLIAGARVEGTLGVYVGQAGVGTGFGAQGGDILIDGTVNGSSVTLNTNSSNQLVNIQTGPSGLISGTGSLTLFNSGLDGGEIDVRSANYGITNVSTGAPNSPVRDIGVTIDQTVGNLRITAVPKSRGQISLKASAPNATITIDSNVETEAGLALEAGTLNVNRPLRTTAGNIVLTGNTVTVGSNVTAGSNGVGTVSIKSRTGKVTLSSAAVVSAIDETITVEAATDIDSQARLETSFLDLSAGGAISLKSNAEEIRAVAGTSITVSDDDSLRVRSAIAGKGDLKISALGLLDVQTANVSAAGAMQLDAGGGLLVGVARTTSGPVSLAARAGDVRIMNTVAVGGANNGLSVASDKGDIVVAASAAVTVPGDIAFTAPVGRVLTPGSVTKVIVENPGAGYTSAPTVVFGAAVPASASAVVARSDQVAAITLAAGGSGYVTPVVAIGAPAPGGVQAAATATVIGGVITGITVTTQGSGYSSSNPPTITITDAGGQGSGAAAVAVIGSKVSGLQVIAGGTGYVTAPTVALVGGGGRDATARAFITNGVVTSLQVTNPGTGYTSAPTVVFSGGSGSGAQAQALIGGVSSIVVGNQGSGYLVPPQVVISAGDGATTGAITVNATGGITGINLSAPGADYGVAPLVEIIDSTGAGSGAAAIAELSQGVGSFIVTNGGAGYPRAPVVTVSPPPVAPGNRTAVIEADISGFVQSLSPLTIGGTGYSPNVQAAFVGGGGTGALAAVTINGSLSENPIPVTAGGTGYSSVPTVVVPLPTLPGGVQATATAFLGLTAASVSLTYDPPTVANPNPTLYSRAPSITFATPAGGQAAQGRIDLDATGQVVGVTILDPGWGYTSLTNANVTISGGTLLGNPGRNLVLTANSANFTVSRIQRTNAGSGYVSDVDLDFTGGGGSGAQSRAQVRGPIAAVALVSGGTGYTAPPQVQFVDAFGVGAAPLTTTLSASVTSLRIVDPGVGYQTAPTLTFETLPGVITPASASVGLTNVVSRIVPTSAGQNYNPATTSIRLTPVAGGGGAVSGAVTVDASGRITSINVATGGQDYVTPPSVTITDTSGSGRQALATAVVTGGRVTGFTINNGGVGYNPQTTTVTLKSAGSGAAAVANLDAAGRVASITVTNSGSGYQSGSGAPVVRLVEYGAGAQATAAVAGGQVTKVTVAPGGGGANYAVAPTVTFVGNGTGATGRAVIGGIAAISGGSLTWTAANGPLDAVLDTFSKVSISLTSPGDLVLNRAQGALTLLGASTKDGSISISAPSLAVAGAVNAGNFSGRPNLAITLAATSGDLLIDAKVGDLVAGANTPTPVTKSITLRADNGSITATDPAAAGLVTTADLVVQALSGITVRTNVSSVRGGATSNAANVSVTQTYVNSDGNVLPITVGTGSGPLESNNGTVTITAASPIRVGKIDAQPSGTIVLSGSSIDEVPVDVGTVDLRAAIATLTATDGLVRLDTSVGSVTASAPLSSIELRNVSGAVLTATLTSRNGVILSSDGTINATSVTSSNGDVAITSVGAGSDISIGTITAPGFPIKLTAGRSILQTNPSAASLTGGSADLTATAGTLDLVLATESASAVAPGAITLRNTGAMQILLADSTGGQPISLTAAGTLSQSGPIRTAGLLSVTGNGVNDIVLRSVANQVGSFAGTNPGAGIAFRSQGALAVAAAGVTGGAIELTAGGDLTQQGVINATVSLDATATSAGAVRLDRVDNTFPTLTGRTFNGGFTVIGAGALTVGTAGVVAGSEAPVAGNGSIAITAMAGGITLVGDLTAVLDTITLQAPAGTVTQTGTSRITTGTLRLTTATPATLIPANNSIGNIIEDLGGNITIGVPGQPITVPDLFTSTGNITILGSTIAIVGAVQAAGAGTITVTASGPVSFGLSGLLTAASVTYSAVGDSQLRVGANVPVAAATVAGGSLALSSTGNLRQTGPIVASALSAAAGAGSIVLGNAGNSVGAFSASAPHSGGNIQFVNAGGFSVTAPGVQAGTSTAGDGFVTLSALSGDLTVGALINAPGDLVELRAPAGRVIVNVTPVAQTLIVFDSTGGSIPSGPIEAGNAEALIGAIDIVNSLPVTGTVYQVIVTASLTLSRTLTFSNAIALSGASSDVVIDGAGTLAQGLVVGSSASGSRITNLAFANFTGAAVSVNGAQNVAIQGLTVTDSATGLLLNGMVNGTTVRGSTFRNVQTAMQLTGAQRATIGGTATSQRNRIEGASQAGVLATGFCTGTRIVGTTFTANPRTRMQFNVRSSRGLRISGTTVERAPRVVRPPISLFGR